MFLLQEDLNYKRQVGGGGEPLPNDPFFSILYILEGIKILRILLTSILFILTCGLVVLLCLLEKQLNIEIPLKA